MKRTNSRLTTAVVLLGASFNVLALGFGGLREPAVLGRPLNLIVPIRVEPGDDFSAACVSAEVSFGDQRLRASVVHAAVEPNGGAIRVTTDVPVEEPVVTVAVKAGCSASMSRTYTVFADPPVVHTPVVVAQAPERTTAAPPTPTPAPRSARTQPTVSPAAEPAAERAPSRPPRPRAAARPPAPAPEARRPAMAPAPASAPKRTTPPAPRPTAEAPRRGPRLQLDTFDAELSTPTLRLSQELSTPQAQTPAEREAAAAAWQAMSASPDERIRDRERLQALERSLLEMRAESVRTRESLDRLQAQLRRAEENRYANPLVYLLVLVCVMLAAALAWVLRQQSGRRTWWAPSALTSESRRGELVPAPEPARARAVAPPAEAENTSPDAKLAVAASTAVRRQQAAADAAAAAQLASTIAHERPFRPSQPGEEVGGANKVSVEELIDLEQQAEFFVALGQEESAIELLRSHVSGHPDGSPLPYLKLLEIYQRRGERLAYDEIRAEFNERFNAYAPAWEDAPSDGRSLEEYPTVISRLQALWENPSRALEVLQASLLRRDASSQTFDLPAYRELLMLYSVARDRVHGVPDADVDVLLPLEDDEEDFPHSMLEPLMATTPVHPYRGPIAGHGVDLELEPPETAPPGAPSSSIDFEPIHLELPSDKRPA
ncbi:hypothetical protein M8A51_10785 [Schlegelella sp. S2-27]|uniref:Tetratricopeptide repeat protein n=1 Tax=Caldimonas mangrovi TaxID=2944811 RepID=A0ABT0YMS2_9BURK|nr:hypothetical protein [Caldimonas mangrovi]MCM5680018.1 hypothetical protein [Caldimonas mangrovi]